MTESTPQLPAATKPSRRWFQFSLRTLFVVVTVICVWLGYSMNWITQRRALANSDRVENAVYLVFWPGENPPAPFPLGLFGEKGAVEIFLHRDASESELASARGLFPEAQVMLDFVHEQVVSRRPTH